MAEPKPMASLTSGLLARKGQAQPAMRRSTMGLGRGAATAALLQDDLGWNDMGFDVEPQPVEMDHAPAPIGLTPLEAAGDSAACVPHVITEREALAERIAATPIMSIRTKAKADAANGRKAAFTLRLNADRHLKLRLASAVTGQSAQQMVTQALDQFLDALPDIDRLAQQLPHRGNT